ncbi:MAG: trypsin-like peptidase domain-containing protein [Phycisphaerales bacterium JB060]
MLRAAIVLSCVVLLGGCTIAGLEETATRQAWPADAETVFGCTPVSVDFFGGRVRGSGSGVFVSDRWLLTAAHVVPEDASYAWLWTKTDGPSTGVAMPVEVVITGGGEPVESGDWALVRFSERVAALGAQPARLLADGFEDARAVLVGFPTRGELEHGLYTPRDVVVLRSDAPGAAQVLVGASEDEPDLRYFRMVPGWSALGGASGGPVVMRDADGRPGVAGLVLGRLEYHGLWRRGRVIVTHDLPPQAHLAASGALDDLPSRAGRDRLLVRTGAGGGRATLTSDGDCVPQWQAASGR